MLTGKFNYWVITDTHFGHQKMEEYCQRPVGFERLIMKQVHHTVQPQDVLIHLGDFCFYNDEAWHERFMAACPGKRWLIRGNHDRKSLGWYLSHGWDFVADEVTLGIFGKRVALSHKPLDISAGFDLNIHGHCHNTGHHPEYELASKRKLLFIEHTYAPVSLRKLVEGGE